MPRAQAPKEALPEPVPAEVVAALAEPTVCGHINVHALGIDGRPTRDVTCYLSHAHNGDHEGYYRTLVKESASGAHSPEDVRIVGTERYVIEQKVTNWSNAVKDVIGAVRGETLGEQEIRIRARNLRAEEKTDAA